MRLTSVGKVGPGGLPLFVADARFFKAAMRRVEGAPRELDPQAQKRLT